VLDLILSAGPVAKVVLLLLLSTSVLSWAIILHRFLTFRKAGAENRAFLLLFSKTNSFQELRQKATKFKEGPIAALFQSVHAAAEKISPASRKRTGIETDDRSLKLARLDRVLKSEIQDEMEHQERYIHLLATIGNTTPFVGLFGTVWGIMRAFREIGLQGMANIAAVAPGVAEALITTAAGLLAAIPAVVAYNLFVNKLRVMEVQLDVFGAELITLVEDQMWDAPSPSK
jgi:biopolymer transport protein TolQ